MVRPRAESLLLSVALFTGSVASAQVPAEAVPPAPAMGCPVAPILDTVKQPGEVAHSFALPVGEWLVRFASKGCSPQELSIRVNGEEAPEGPLARYYQRLDTARISLAQPGSVYVAFEASYEDVGALYCLSVHPVRPRPKWEPVLEQVVELDPRFQFPTLDGPRCAAPITAMLQAGMRYRLRVQSDDVDVRLLVPAQNGLRQLDEEQPLERVLDREFGQLDPGDDSVRQFVAPRDGSYLFWCIAERANYRSRPRVILERSYTLGEGIFPQDLLSLVPDPGSIPGTVVAWHRPDLWITQLDPALFVPIPSRQVATITFRSAQTAGEYVLRGGDGITHPVSVAAGSTQRLSVTLLDGEPGVWLESRGSNGPIDVEMRLAQSGAYRSGAQRRHQVLQLPVVLRGSARAGNLLSVRVRGACCAPQVTMRGAGITAQCMDPTGFSQGAMLEGMATRDGEVEVLVTATAAEPGAVALVCTDGFVAMPVGSALLLDLPSLQWISTPGADVLATAGEWTETDEKLPAGTKVDWYRVPMKAGRVYRILATARQTPDLVLDVPGIDRSSAGGGIAILVPRADGDATLGIAAAGADELGAYALQVCDLGPETTKAGEETR